MYNTASVDYDAVTTTITLSDNNRLASISILIIDDETVELNEHFFIRIKVNNGSTCPVELALRETEIIILNDDGK